MNKKFLIIVLVVLMTPASIFSQSTKFFGQEQIQDSFHRARIFYMGDDNFNLLRDSGICMDHGIHKKGIFIESDFSQAEILIAESLGMEVEILIENVSQFYRQRSKSQEVSSYADRANTDCDGGSEIIDYPTPDNFELGSTAGYFTLDEMLDEIDQMHELYPELITAKSPISDFTTFEGRSIYWVKMSDNPEMDEDEPKVLMDAIHHAREPMSLSQLIFYMWYLLENYDTDPEVQTILNNTEMYFVPVLNVDGYNYNNETNPGGGGLWRKNRRDHFNGDYGVDNNRNYSIEWGTTGVDDDTDGATFPGEFAFSEAENQAMKWFCEEHDFRVAMNNHSYSDLVLYPFGWDYDQFTPEHDYFVDMTTVMVEQNGFANIISADLYPASGDSDDWMYTATEAKPRVIAMTPEIGNNDQGFWPAEVEIIDVAKSCVWQNLVASHIATKFAKAKEVSEIAIGDIDGNFMVEIQNFGMSTPLDYTITYEYLTSNITSIGPETIVTGMELGEIQSVEVPYELDASVTNGDLVEFNIIVDQGGFTTSTFVSKIFGELTAVFNDAGDDLENWNGDWETTTEDFFSESTSVTDSPFDNYENGVESEIVLSEEISLIGASTALLTFRGKWDIEAGWDFAQVMVSTNGGISWIPQCGNYTKIGNDNQDEGQPLYDGVQGEWVLEEINLSDYLGQEILIKFYLESDNFVTGDGFYFDDIEVIVDQTTDSVEELENESLISSFPNPVRNNCQFKIDSKEKSTLVITNDLGQIVNQIELQANQRILDYNTSGLESGVYFYYLNTDNVTSKVQRFVVIH